MISYRNKGAWIAGLAATASLFASAALAQDTAAGLVLVTTDRPARCTVQGAPGGGAPLLVRVAPGAHTVTCSAVIEGVNVQRIASFQLSPGYNLKIHLSMLGEAAR